MKQILPMRFYTVSFACFALFNFENVPAFRNIPKRFRLKKCRDQSLYLRCDTSPSVDVISSNKYERMEVKHQRRKGQLVTNSDSIGLKQRLEIVRPTVQPGSRTRGPKSDSTAIIFNCNHNRPNILTKEEERKLSYDMKKLRECVHVREDLFESKIESNEVENFEPSELDWANACGMALEELRDIVLHGQDARSKMIASHGGLVGSIARKYFKSVKVANEFNGGMGTILSYHDLVQEGNLGLMEAAERFEPERGFKFSTYATWWVRQRMLQAISDYSRIIRLPAHVHQIIQKMQKTRKTLKQENGRQPSNLELAHHLGISIEKLDLYSDASRTVLSLESPIRISKITSIEQAATLGDFISSDSPSPKEEAESSCLRESIISVVFELPIEEKDVLMARFGLDDGAPKSVRETAERLGVSCVRVRFVEARALKSLRKPQYNHKLKSYVLGSRVENEESEGNEINRIFSPEEMWSFDTLNL